MWKSDKDGNHFKPKTKKPVTGVQSCVESKGVSHHKFLKGSDTKKTIQVPADPDAKVDVEIDINNTSGEESKVEDSSKTEKNDFDNTESASSDDDN